MPPRFLLVGGVKPLHLTQTRPRRPEMREIDRARLVVVGEVARLPTVGRGLDDRERGGGEAGGVGPRPPLRGEGGAPGQRGRSASHVRHTRQHRAPPVATTTYRYSRRGLEALCAFAFPEASAPAVVTLRSSVGAGCHFAATLWAGPL